MGPADASLALGLRRNWRQFTLLALVNQLPDDCVFSAFAIGRAQLPYVALAPIVGGNVRVGLEDNLHLGPGRLATNAELVGRAVSIMEGMNVSVMSPAAESSAAPTWSTCRCRAASSPSSRAS